MNDLMAKYGNRLWLAHLHVADTTAIMQVVEKALTDLGRMARPDIAGGRVENPGSGIALA